MFQRFVKYSRRAQIAIFPTRTKQARQHQAKWRRRLRLKKLTSTTFRSTRHQTSLFYFSHQHNLPIIFSCSIFVSTWIAIQAKNKWNFHSFNEEFFSNSILVCLHGQHFLEAIYVSLRTCIDLNCTLSLLICSSYKNTPILMDSYPIPKPILRSSPK